MEIKWGNLMAFLLALFAVIIAITMRSDIAAFLRTLGDIGPGHSVEQQTRGLMAFGLVAVVVVALARILVQGRSDGPQ